MLASRQFIVFKNFKNDIEKQKEWNSKYGLIFKIGGFILFIYSIYSLYPLLMKM